MYLREELIQLYLNRLEKYHHLLYQRGNSVIYHKLLQYLHHQYPHDYLNSLQRQPNPMCKDEDGLEIYLEEDV